ncbi:energy transducer TonB [Kalamiella sp. sgz302252]|uniref:energy transducer TonB family protein n=1 Tax=Pantoea sp. sgz302252 TaxID=3341827 RepID=UPI0036D3B8CF
MYSVYRFRHIFSWLPVLLAAGWMLMNQHATLSIKPRYDESTMELALVDLTPPVEAQPEAQPEPVPEPDPEPEPEATVPSPEPVAPPKPKPAPKPKAAAKPKPVARPASRFVAEPVRRQPAVAPATAAPKPAAPRVDNASIENGWVAGLRSDLEAQKRYPTGRQASLERPEGSVEIWLEVDRSGRVLASGISNKARSMLLNRAALGSLQNIRQVKPFPTDAFTGQNSRRFTATLNYRAP